MQQFLLHSHARRCACLDSVTYAKAEKPFTHVSTNLDLDLTVLDR
jgi:hypothetical protein